MIKKKWFKPKLIVLSSEKIWDETSQERVMQTCKNNATNAVPSTQWSRCGQNLTQCWYYACGACSTNTVS